MGSLCSQVPQEQQGRGRGWSARLPTLSGARDLLGVAGREVKPRDPQSLKNQDKESEHLDPTMFLVRG